MTPKPSMIDLHAQLAELETNVQSAPPVEDVRPAEPRLGSDSW